MTFSSINPVSAHAAPNPPWNCISQRRWVYDMDYARNAKKLFIHKNTAIYRIMRLEELFHPDLKDCRVITTLYLSLFKDYKRTKTGTKKSSAD
jgi:hypothetical protein